MPKRTDIQSILTIGAGPIVIGQACEFDYFSEERVLNVQYCSQASPGPSQSGGLLRLLVATTEPK